MKILLIILVLFYSACAQTLIGNNYHGFDNWVTQFITDATINNTPLNIRSITIIEYTPDDQKPGEIARCTKYPDYGVIMLFPSFWEHVNFYERTASFYHEMGHCVLGYVHRDNSIMQPNLYDLKASNYNSSMHEFFHPGGQ